MKTLSVANLNRKIATGMSVCHRRRQRQDRKGMRDWLEDHLNNSTYSDQLQWTDKPRRKFCLRWTHRSRATYNEEVDSAIFRAWAIHTGKFLPQNPDPSRWKANFRCALNSIKDVRAVGEGHTCRVHKEKFCREFYFVETNYKVKKPNKRKERNKNAENVQLIKKEEDAITEETMTPFPDTDLEPYVSTPAVLNVDFSNDWQYITPDTPSGNDYYENEDRFNAELDELFNHGIQTMIY